MKMFFNLLYEFEKQLIILNVVKMHILLVFYFRLSENSKLKKNNIIIQISYAF